MSQFDRTTMLIGKQAQSKLINSRVAVFGLGGVGSFVVEALARAGVGNLTLVDDDVVSETNLNRQLFALHSTLGMAKTQVASIRVADINPRAVATPLPLRFDETTVSQFDFSAFDYVVDAVDTVTSKVLLAEACAAANTPIISCMGTGNKLDAASFCVADIFDTSVCPLAKVMRKLLKERGIRKLKVVYSKEQPLVPFTEFESAHPDDAHAKRQTPASISFVPPVAGMILAGEVIKDLIKV
ncbi:MAG: tRNA threonylcarbamoyladenosine dehydratase [Corallococcus sp.]|nr:tRNA threonylcarbamoyladenosine dehydratase [Corallococcus sp.]MCM1358965.1 tRNA threonylcarbamoyladenosine dehydratase [Corallococcus sp.]MCM1394954.1 tRNA threonylcarbamoyladenosine dehydratase [Corallococcus sp.]